MLPNLLQYPARENRGHPAWAIFMEDDKVCLLAVHFACMMLTLVIYMLLVAFFFIKIRHKFTLSTHVLVKVLATLLGIFYETHNKAVYHCVKEERVETLSTPHTLTSSVS